MRDTAERHLSALLPALRRGSSGEQDERRNRHSPSHNQEEDQDEEEGQANAEEHEKSETGEGQEGQDEIGNSGDEDVPDGIDDLESSTMSSQNRAAFDALPSYMKAKSGVEMDPDRVSVSSGPGARGLRPSACAAGTRIVF